MSSISVNTITDANGGATTSVNGFTPTASNMAGRNLIINGGMNIWQRATSHTTASGYNSVDRWSFNTYTGGAFTVSKEVDSVHGDYLKWNRTAQDTSHPNAGNAIQQAIENAQYVVGGQYVTVSFWLKDEAGLGSGFVRIRQAASPYGRINTDNTDGTWVSSSTDWEYHTFTFQVKSAAEIAMPHIQLLIQMDNGTAQGGVSITKVQLEVGSVATPFEHRPYGQELALCKRYYSNLYANSGTALYFLYVGAYTSTVNACRGVVNLSPPMRAAPSFSYTGTIQSNPSLGTVSLSLSTATIDKVRIDVDHTTAATAAGSYGLFATNVVLSFSAEL